MKIGLSFSRCLRDIVEGKVLEQDVIVIVARTDFDPTNDEQWTQIWQGYRYGGWSNPEWEDSEPNMSDEEANTVYRNACISLYNAGKIHQPRKFGAKPGRMPYYWLETFVPENELGDKPAVKAAWEQYKVIARLSSKRPQFNDNF